MAGLLKVSAVAVLAALTISTATALNGKPVVIVHGDGGSWGHGAASPTPVPTPTPTPAALVGVHSVCLTKTKKCCWDPVIIGLVHRTEELTVVVDCQKAVLVETSCALPSLPAGVHEVVEGAAAGGPSDLDTTERPNYGAAQPTAVPTKCFEHKKVAHTCHKQVTVTKAYPRIGYKKSCVRSQTPEEWDAPKKYVAWAFGEEVGHSS